jgi:RHS repeat-associated protein
LDQAGAIILQYGYDPDNRLTSRWSAAKGNTGYIYDSVGNLLTINYPTSGTINFRYDALNRLTNMVDAAGTTVYSYDAAGQLLTTSGPFASDAITSTYMDRLRTTLTLQQPTGVWTNSFAYDSVKRLTNVTSQAGRFGSTYQSGLPSLLPTGLSLPNGAHLTNFYDSDARLLGTYLINSGNTVLDSYGYLYDPANQRTNLIRADGSTVAYTYDRIGQLVGDTAGDSYVFDTAWNLTNHDGSPYHVDVKNQLTTAQNVPFIYDQNGNPTTYSAEGTAFLYTMSYDDENRLASFYQNSGSSNRTELVYDGLGKLRRQLQSFWGGSGWIYDGETRYIYDGKRVIQERDSNNNPTISYTRGSDLSGSMEGAGGIGGLLSRSVYSLASHVWTNHAFYFADGNGNVTYMIDANQAMVASYRYDPFGMITGQNGSLANANVYRFSSKELVPFGYFGLYYYGYRFYDPNLQRWLNRDPIEESGGANLYGYCFNSPARFTDPMGLDSTGITLLPPGRSPGYMGGYSACADACSRQLDACMFSLPTAAKAAGGPLVGRLCTGKFNAKGGLAGVAWTLGNVYAGCMGAFLGCMSGCPPPLPYPVAPPATGCPSCRANGPPIFSNY